MCGRTACTLSTCNMRRACTYRDKKGRRVQPQCHDNGQVYKPSHNLCPTDVSLVLIAGSHLNKEELQILCPMVWGMIPPWHSSDTHKNHGLTTHNCRLESVNSSRLYKKPLALGQRCVIVCSGFYEWQTTKGLDNKVPYFIHNKQPEGVNILDSGPFSWSEENGWTGPRLLRIAGLFDTWLSMKGQELYSYTMITVEADSTLSWLHRRQPAFLETDEQVTAWLDNTNIPSKEAVKILKPPKNLCWYRVSTHVNNCHNKDPACSQPLKEGPPEKSTKSSLMSSWLTKSSPKKRQSDSAKDEATDVKKIKHESSDTGEEKPSTSPKDKEAEVKLEPKDDLQGVKQEDVKQDAQKESDA